MADVSKLNVNGTSYDIKDSTARTTANQAKTAADNAQSDADAASSAASAAQTTATQALNKANANESAIADISATYNSETETITFKF